MRRDLGEEVEFYEAVELAGGELVLEAKGFEEGFVQESRCWDTHADSLGGGFRVDVGVELYFGKGAIIAKAVVIAVVA